MKPGWFAGALVGGLASFLAGCSTPAPPTGANASSAAPATPHPAYSSFTDALLCRTASKAPVGSAWDMSVPNVYAAAEAQLRGLTLNSCKDIVEAADIRARAAALPSPPRPAPPKIASDPIPNATPVHLDGTRRIKLVNHGGTFSVPVLLNDALQLQFVVDSGAGDVTVPSDIIATLRKVDAIDPSDLRETRNHVLADGRLVPFQTVIIRSLKLGDIEVNNVVGSVNAAGGALLLGQTFLKRFKSWSIDNARGELVLQ